MRPRTSSPNLTGNKLHRQVIFARIFSCKSTFTA